MTSNDPSSTTGGITSRGPSSTTGGITSNDPSSTTGGITSSATSGITDSGPTIRRLDDPAVPWQRVKAQLNADGTESSVWEKWFAFRVDPPYLSLYAHYDSGMVVRRHGHRSPHVVFVLEGEILVGDELCGAGTHIELPSGAQFGPLVAGDDGCTLFEVMLGDPRSWSDDPEAFTEACAARGVTPLPDPEIDFPDWLEDERARWLDSRDTGDGNSRPDAAGSSVGPERRQ